MKAPEIVSLLNLHPHPEGGFYTETFRDTSITLLKSSLPPQYQVDRAVSSAIYFLLPSGNVAKLHRLPCAETFHFHMGEPLTVVELTESGGLRFTVIGPDLSSGQKLQYTVPPCVWFGMFLTGDIQAYSPDGSSLAESPGRDPDVHFCLIGVTCAPAFEFQDQDVAELSQLLPLAPNAEPFLRLLT